MLVDEQLVLKNVKEVLNVMRAMLRGLRTARSKYGWSHCTDRL
ncbi:hypothetical protein [Bradyrhizobium arachidis]|nr:hypothetical protein [Bradyrhizobium arachidis]